jgi:hypothetical protein
MALITAPTFALAAIEWELDRPAQINSDVSNKRTVDEPLYGKWFARVDLEPVTGESTFAPVRSFLMRCMGCVNSFQLPAVIEAQNANSGVTLAADAAAGATSITLSGATTALLDGQMVTLADQLLQLTADQSGGAITFEPPLRVAATAGAAVETAMPYALVRLADPNASWQVDAPNRFGASFMVEEVVGA